MRRNAQAWRTLLGRTELWACVKSDAYRLGAVGVARASLAGGARRLCVVDVEEARELRAGGIGAPIVQICATPTGALDEALALGVTACIEDFEGAVALSRRAEALGRDAVAHVAVDTGTGWSGVSAASAGSFADAVRALGHVRWEGAWTHVAGRESLARQRAAFDAAVAAMRASGLTLGILHLASTGPALWGAGGDAARIGIGLFGSTLGEVESGFEFRTALEVRAAVVSIKTFSVDTPLGYGGKDVAKAGQRIATLRIGYADGLPPGLRGAEVIIDGRKASIVGAIGMNFTMVALPSDATVVLGGEAIVLGEDAGVRLDEVARRCGVTPHSLVAGLGASLRRG